MSASVSLSVVPLGLVSAWVAVPVAAALMFMIAGHVLALQRASSELPASRRRIRTANGLVMLVLAPLLAYALSNGPGTDQPRPMAALWLLILSMLVMVVGLAAMDVLNTVRLARAARRGRGGRGGRVRR